MPDANGSSEPIHMMPEVVLMMVNLDDQGVPLPPEQPGRSENQPVVMMPEIVCEMINGPQPPDRSR